MLSLNGTIAEDSWFDDDVTPGMFKDELMAGDGDITVWINSPGGDCVAAAQIYNMLAEYPGKVTVKIDGLAASAASVIAMAGNEVQMSPVSMMMIHNPATIAWGDHSEMQKAIDLLDAVKESIINAYVMKTGLSRARLSHLMDAETWMDANKAVELGFADSILFQKAEDGSGEDSGQSASSAFEVMQLVVTVKEMKNYLRVDFDDDDVLLSDLIEQGQQICMDVARITDEDEFEDLQGTKIAVQYAAAYLYEHREEADHHQLVMDLRSLLFGVRKPGF